MKLSHMTWPQVEDYFKERDIVLVAIGSVECHGRHMPLGTDTLIPDNLIERIEKESDVLIAPTMPYGCTDYLANFPGTVNLGHDVTYQVMKQILDSLYTFGARHFVVLNGHGGNIPVLDRLALDFEKKGALLSQMNWWMMVWNIVADYNGNKPWQGGHGGAQETSAILAIDPSLVDKSEIQDSPMQGLSNTLPASGMKTVTFEGVEIPVPRMSDHISENGWFGKDHPKDSNREWGEEMLEECAKYIVKWMKEFEAVNLPKKEG